MLRLENVTCYLLTYHARKLDFLFMASNNEERIDPIDMNEAPMTLSELLSRLTTISSIAQKQFGEYSAISEDCPVFRSSLHRALNRSQNLFINLRDKYKTRMLSWDTMARLDEEFDYWKKSFESVEDDYLKDYNFYIAKDASSNLKETMSKLTEIHILRNVGNGYKCRCKIGLYCVSKN